MAVEPSGAVRHSFDLKSAQLPVLAVTLRSTDTAAVIADLARHLADDPDFFDNDPVLIDLSHVCAAGNEIDFAALIEALRSHRTVPVAVCGGNAVQIGCRTSGSGLCDHRPQCLGDDRTGGGHGLDLGFCLQLNHVIHPLGKLLKSSVDI